MSFRNGNGLILDRATWPPKPGIMRAFIGLFVVAVVLLALLALKEYKGQPFIYLLFTLIANGLLYCGFRRNAIYFDTFIGIWLWLGFWLKLSVSVAFNEGLIPQSIGQFDGSGEAFDASLLAVCSALAGFISFSFLREKFLFNYPGNEQGESNPALHAFYSSYRGFILLAFVILIAGVAITNVYFGIYQRGMIATTVLPYGLNGVYKWLLLFGLASISALIVKFEYFSNRGEGYLVAFIALLEAFASNVSLLSRGMILNSSALFIGFHRSLARARMTVRLRFLIVCGLMLVVLFGGSVLAVNYVRLAVFDFSIETGARFPTDNTTDNRFGETITRAKAMIVDRWVGIEGVHAVSGYPDKGWDLWFAALQEKYSPDSASFYDENLIVNPYVDIDTSKNHFISLPGIVAFFYYPGSNPFLFCSMFLAALFAFLLELCAFKLGGRNTILCALIGQVVAFRYASFGYLPGQSYLLFGSIILNLLLIYLAEKSLATWFRRNKNQIL